MMLQKDPGQRNRYSP